MKKSVKNVFVILYFVCYSVVLYAGGFGQMKLAGDSILPIVPAPQKVEFTGSDFSFAANDTVLVHLFVLSINQDLKALEELQNVSTAIFADTEIASSSENALPDSKPKFLLGTPNHNPTFDQILKERNITTDDLGEEGYQLSIEPGLVIMVANTPAGLLYAVQSLKQLFRVYRPHSYLPGVKITDFPTFKYRAVMDDISRGPLPNMDFMKSQIRRLSELKINLFTFYIEHVVKTEKHPGFSPPEGITMEEFRELSAYATPYNVQLMGSFQSLGHGHNVLSAASHQHLGATHRMFKPANPEVLQFLKEVYDEMLPAFSSDFFNINGDEAWDLARLPDAENTPGLMYANHVVPLLEHLENQGKKPMLWGDMALAYPEVFSYLPKSSTVLTWNYDGREDFSEFIDPIREAGLDFWICPGVLNSHRTLPDFEEATVNIRNFIREGLEKGASGVMTCVWDDGGRHFFSKDWYGIAYAAEQSWKPNSRPTELFDQRFSRAFFADEAGLLPKYLGTLNELGDLSVTQKMNTQFFEKQLLPKPGEFITWRDRDQDEIRLVLEKAKAIFTQLQEHGHSLTKETFAQGEKWGPESLYLAYDDLPFVFSTIWHYEMILISRQTLLEMGDWYRKAIKWQKKDREKADQYLTYTLKGADFLNQNWNRFWPKAFQQQWLQENRSYWLDEALATFQKRGKAFSELDSRLRKAAQNFMPENGKYLPTPLALGLDIRLTQSAYFTFWLLSPLYPIEVFGGSYPDFLSSLGGEGTAKPTPYDWQKYESTRVDVLDLAEYHGGSGPGIAYAYATLESPSAQKIKASVGSSDGVELFLNGQSVFRKNIPRKWSPDTDEVWLDLKEGKNHLLLKLARSKSEWRFSFQLPEVEMRHRKHKYHIIQDK